MTLDPNARVRESDLRCTDPDLGARRAAYELGILAPGEQAAFEEHLRVCDACVEELYTNAPATAVMHEMPGPLTERLDMALRAREAEDPARTRRRRRTRPRSTRA